MDLPDEVVYPPKTMSTRHTQVKGDEGALPAAQETALRTLAEHADRYGAGSMKLVGGARATVPAVKKLGEAGLAVVESEVQVSQGREGWGASHGKGQRQTRTTAYVARVTPAGLLALAACDARRERALARGMDLSDVEHAALRDLVARYDALVRHERERWGNELRGGVDVTPQSGRSQAERRKLILALETAGAIVVDRTSYEVEGPLRKGSFGRLLGGSHKGWSGSWVAKPTAAGRRAAAS